MCKSVFTGPVMEFSFSKCVFMYFHACMCVLLHHMYNNGDFTSYQQILLLGAEL